MLNKIQLPPAANVFIWAGINDLLMDRKLDAIENNYADIIARVRRASPAARITLISVLPTANGAPLHASIEALNLRLAGLAAKADAQFIDVRPAVASDTGYLDPFLALWDGIHPNGPGLTRIEALLTITNPSYQAGSN
jgi:lysophospholipase L1-like esterase